MDKFYIEDQNQPKSALESDNGIIFNIKKSISPLNILFLLLSTFVLTMAVTPAFSATHTYASNWSAPMGVERTTPATNIIGGGIQTPLFLAGSAQITVRTFLAHPGYQILASATGKSPGWVNVSHGTYSAANSGCFWLAPYDIGPIIVNCNWKS